MLKFTNSVSVSSIFVFLLIFLIIRSQYTSLLSPFHGILLLLQVVGLVPIYSCSVLCWQQVRFCHVQLPFVEILVELLCLYLDHELSAWSSHGYGSDAFCESRSR